MGCHMTMPSERTRSVFATREFLLSLCDSKATPRVPKIVREEARRCLRHFPGVHEMVLAGRAAPEAFDLLTANQAHPSRQYVKHASAR